MQRHLTELQLERKGDGVVSQHRDAGEVSLQDHVAGSSRVKDASVGNGLRTVRRDGADHLIGVVGHRSLLLGLRTSHTGVSRRTGRVLGEQCGLSRVRRTCARAPADEVGGCGVVAVSELVGGESLANVGENSCY